MKQFSTQKGENVGKKEKFQIFPNKTWIFHGKLSVNPKIFSMF